MPPGCLESGQRRPKLSLTWATALLTLDDTFAFAAASSSMAAMALACASSRSFSLAAITWGRPYVKNVSSQRWRRR